ncbi:MAG: DNA polymerase IV [bacterium]|nr:DNA polymerase IV [bacterium]
MHHNKRIILHIDFNSFFASVEQQANPFLRGKPIAITGKSKRALDSVDLPAGIRLEVKQTDMTRTVVTTASKEAKALGVKTAMSSHEAKRIAPELILIPGDPRKYSEITRRFLRILKRYTPLVEQFSMDEAFADLTHIAEDYMGATLIAQMMRNDIANECGEACTVSLGIAPNKTMAKLACESKKPSGLTVIPDWHVQEFVLQQPLASICGIGHRIEARLARMGITSMRELKRASRHELHIAFKQYGGFLYDVARGHGSDTITAQKEDPKSIGHSYTFPHNLIHTTEINRHLLAICEKVGFRLRKKGFYATRLNIHLRYGNTRSDGMSFRFKDPLADTLDLYKQAYTCMEKIRHRHEAIRLIGLSVSGLVKSPPPISLWPKQEKHYEAILAVDALSQRYGFGTVKRGSTINLSFKERVSGWHYDHEQ